MQRIGDGGWQLSHGERSRLFIARALLQSPDVLVLDESLSSLDPESRATSLDCVLQKVRTVVIVAHR
jgi:ATP-binding cassette subfamily B protein